MNERKKNLFLMLVCILFGVCGMLFAVSGAIEPSPYYHLYRPFVMAIGGIISFVSMFIGNYFQEKWKSKG